MLLTRFFDYSSVHSALKLNNEIAKSNKLLNQNENGLD